MTCRAPARRSLGSDQGSALVSSIAPSGAEAGQEDATQGIHRNYTKESSQSEFHTCIPNRSSRPMPAGMLNHLLARLSIAFATADHRRLAAIGTTGMLALDGRVDAPNASHLSICAG